MMHETMNWISHGWSYGLGPLTALIILILAAIGVAYIIQKTTQNTQRPK